MMYSNESGGQSGGGMGDWIKVIGGAIDSGFKFGQSANELKGEKEKTKQTIYNKLFGDGEKTNWLPIIALTGVLAIGGIVVYMVLKSRQATQ